MSKINAVRLINLNYNNNAIKVSDETFHFNGESTLLSLRNGGGKSVLVQMMMAPFVHRRYRDAKDRPFESYFTMSKPTFILVEWVLDQNAGYVLTGLMVRKRQEFSDEDRDHQEELEIVSMISEYKEQCIQDIHHLPVLEKTKKELVLKNFGACRQLFETYKRERSMQFFHYDMNNSAQSRQYFDKLKEYQIDYKEWESIIKKVNLKESGLSDLFSDCKDEKGLVEKWFLDAVENKLNKERSQMKEFQTIVGKYVAQYRENRSKIKRYDTIRRFGEEADRIRKEAVKYDAAARLVGEHENLIAGFIGELEHCMEEEGHTKEEIRKEIEEIQEKISYLTYEKLSGELYQMKKEEEYRSSNKELLDMEREAFWKEQEQIEYRLHLLECARQQETTDEDRQALSEARQNLEVSRQREMDLEPERRRIGWILKNHYGETCSVWKKKQQENEVGQKKTDTEIAEAKEHMEELQKRLFDEAVQIAGQKTKIEAFDQTEHVFNQRYEESLFRNILGEYEPAALDVCKEEYVKKLEQLVRERTSSKKRLGEAGEEKKNLTRAAEDSRQECFAAKGKRQDNLHTRDLYEKELGERKTILRYFELEEKELFHTDKILSSAERKMQEIGRIRRSLEKEEDLLQKEITRLTEGKVLELPPVFEEMLESIGLQTVYGMEWLKKNGYTKEQNNRLVASHPFLPYALVFSGQELARLTDYLKREAGGEAYTSFPIPIILREQLEESFGSTESAVIELESVRFYVAFNKNLMDTEKLERMIHEKERQVEKLSKAIFRKKEEYDDYAAKKEKIRNQQITRELYEENRNLLVAAEQEIVRLETVVLEKENGLATLEQELDGLRSHIVTLEKNVDKAQQRLNDFKEYCTAYDIYLEGRRELEHRQKAVERMEGQIRLFQERMEKLESERKSLEHAGGDITRRLEQLQSRYAVYADFAEAEAEENEIEKERKQAPEELEARYQAITAQFSLERKELEKRLEQCRQRSEQSDEQLLYLKGKYKMSQKEWSGILYNRKEEQHQESLLEDVKRKIQRKDSLWNEEDKNLAVIRQQISGQTKKLLEECGKEEPLPKDKIVTADYEARSKLLAIQKAEAVKREAAVSTRINGYEGNLTALAEYAYLVIWEPVEWKQDFGKMGRKELDVFKGEMIRDYRISMDTRQECRNSLAQLLNKIVCMELFQEDFYRKPLEALAELSEDAKQVIAQLDITVQSYQSLMEKLEVDISIVEREKAKIIELLEDYVREVHENLGKIDRNSTITVRDRPVKMLKIQLPSWEENEALYQLRLSDFMDEATKRGMEIFEKNENAADYFGARVTTKNLYDTVVGLSNVQIRLYKIEEQREYPITWADVAKNSGGEGFLSAFVILSCLLYYMRKDESDIFADRNEGKVLVMDNPFAQTNAAHLLKPLMDMAKKANTQLICLSGLGGESIYSRFDNIYVLNLIAASLRSGMQYLRTDHIKGAKAETIIASRIEVVEQQELFFPEA